MVFDNMQAREQLSQMLNSSINVRGVAYNFGDMIENETVDQFPIYSHRMRSNFVKGARIFDGLVSEIRTKLPQMEQEIRQAIERYKETQLNEVNTRINRFDSLMSGANATDTTAGLITQNKVRELALAKMQEYGYGSSNVIFTNMNNNSLNSGIYITQETSSKLDNATTIYHNIQYQQYGIQYRFSEKDNPRMQFRALRYGNDRTEWKEVLTNKDKATTDNIIALATNTEQNTERPILDEEYTKWLKGLVGNNPIKKLDGRTSVSVVENDILVYHSQNKVNLYKVLKNGSIILPSDEYTEKLELSSGLTFQNLKKKILIGKV